MPRETIGLLWRALHADRLLYNTPMPVVELQDAASRADYRAREIADQGDYETWWERAVEAYPEYAKYRQRTARRIPIFLLEAIDESPSTP